MKSFTGKVAVVTGAGSGIGRALVLRLLAEGARVAASDIDDAALSETAAIASAGERLRAYRLDVADRDAIYSHADQVVADFGQVDLVVNNAGVALKGSVREMTDDELRWVMDIDFWGVVHGSRAFLPHLVASGDGHLVNVSSVFGLIAVPTQSAYNAAKFAVRGFTEALRQEMVLEGTNVGVSCVHPGGIKTNIARNGRTSNPADAAEFSKSIDQVAMTSPKAAARTILNGVKRNKARILVGPDAYAIDALPRVLGSLYQPLVIRAAKRQLGQ
ncbi:SDR family NAD(P)-dependent oxidoreductase [Actinokineospora iranica]|uniref:NADP-dependent 3-hydroxy acid dehydrogenase YdfG n=1 Tax=Actinokineospora iranica TaxID=1271860 RepID=A0A1G6SW19_9PSEU|nr:SDR family NAD(P)-dependent oxidoreductase [Actinokineospora iranica]SDD20911.1 NADP-dependent 3-hydroxy acid dehydrogenase YdfG [Actinokineospora iranica]